LKKDIFPILRESPFDATYTAALSGGAGNDPKKVSGIRTGPVPGDPTAAGHHNAWSMRTTTAEISYQYERFIPEIRKARFSREGGDTYVYIALIKKDARYVAVLYARTREVDGPMK